MNSYQTHNPNESVESEQSLLGHLMYNNAIIHVVASQLIGDMFCDPLHRLLYKAMLELSEAGHKVEPVTLAAQMTGADSLFKAVGGVLQYTTKLVNQGLLVFDHEPYCQIIKEMYTRRAAKEIMQGVINKMDTSLGIDDTVIDLLEQMHARMDSLHNGGSIPHYSSSVVMEELLEWMKREGQNQYSTGLARLDAAMGGGIECGRVYGIVAQPKAGKTMLAGTISNALVSQKVKNAYLCLEMKPREIFQRMIGAIAKAKMNDMNSDKWKRHTHNQASLYKAFKDSGHGEYLYFSGIAGATFDELRAAFAYHLRVSKCKAFIVDYMQLVTGKPKGENEARFFDTVASWLASFARKHDVSVIMILQMNKDGTTLGSNGARRACDQMFALHKCDEDRDDLKAFRWMEQMDSRNTEQVNLGNEAVPYLRLVNGTHFEEVGFYSPAIGSTEQWGDF